MERFNIIKAECKYAAEEYLEQFGWGSHQFTRNGYNRYTLRIGQCRPWAAAETSPEAMSLFMDMVFNIQFTHDVIIDVIQAPAAVILFVVLTVIGT